MISAFAITCFAAISIPRPDKALIINMAANHGRHQSFLVIFGICVGYLLHTILCALGIGVISWIVTDWLDTLKILGALYIGYVGISIYKSAAPYEGSTIQQANVKSVYRGLFSNLENPKCLLFFVAAVPQFIDYGSKVSVFLQTWVLGGVTIAMVAI